VIKPRTRWRYAVSFRNTVIDIPDLVTHIKVEDGRLFVMTDFKIYRVQFRPGKKPRVRCLGLKSERTAA
jgi:hypothetical protein